MFKNKTFRLSKDVAISKIGDQAILLSLKSGKYYELNKLGATIVSICSDYMHYDNVKDYVLDAFNVSSEEFENDLEEFLKDLVNKELIEIKNETS